MKKHRKSAAYKSSKRINQKSPIRFELAFPPQPTPVLKTKRVDKFGNRANSHISLHQAKAFLSGIEDAIHHRRPPNVHKTVNFAAMGIKDEDAVKAIGHLIKGYRDWLARKGEKLIWNWARENPEKSGTHVHILMHVPPEFAPSLRERQYHWLNQIERKYQTYEPRKRKGRILTKRVGGTLKTYQNNPSKYRENLNIVVGYVLKGASNEALRSLGIAHRHVDCGTVIGKRVGRWQRRPLKTTQSS